MTKSRHIHQPRHRWTDTQTALLRAQYADTPTQVIATQLGISLDRVYAKAKRLGLSKSAAYLASPAACRLRRGDNIGKAYRYPKGHVPANKGLRGQPSVGRMAQTQFKPGAMPHTWMPVGGARIDRDGYHYVKLRETTPPRFGWVQVHHLVWELHRGPIPRGHIISFRDGDKTHIAIDNLECLSLRENMQRNTLHRYPKEITHAIQLRGAINRRINQRLKETQANEHPSNQ